MNYKTFDDRRSMGCKVFGDRRRMLEKIGELDFVLVDMGLYLDTHPCDQQALEFYRHHSEILKEMKQEFAQNYGPLTLRCGMIDDCEWKWATQDWPWEGGYY